MAQGKYFRFLDSDDWFDKKNFITFLNKLRSSNSDLIFTNAVHLNIKDLSIIKDIRFSDTLKEDVEYDAETIVWDHIRGSEALTNFHTCTYKTELLKPLLPLFLERQSYDDAILFIAPIMLAKQFRFLRFINFTIIFGDMRPKVHLRKHSKAISSICKSNKISK